MKKAPWMWLLAGPNGAGKSTTGRELLAGFGIEELLNPDEFAARLGQSDAMGTQRRAGIETITRERMLIQTGRSFARETTLAGRTILATIVRARSFGYRIGLIYVGLGNVELAISRVRVRVAKGGHDVPEVDIRRRYIRSLGNLRQAVLQADQAHILDNSSTRHPAIRLMELRAGKIVYQLERLPRWLRLALGSGGSKRSAKRR
ncbi:MAG TPA: zeta toxin family protein [Candidatus Binataceae bacterium]|nr:zeta toxin family protein [Candidatus Binataceae bacterium]